jgi:hypothetical protein
MTAASLVPPGIVEAAASRSLSPDGSSMQIGTDGWMRR